MASATWLNPTGCFPLSNWLSAFVPILDALMNRIWSFPKRSRDYALGPLQEFQKYSIGSPGMKKDSAPFGCNARLLIQHRRPFLLHFCQRRIDTFHFQANVMQALPAFL